MNYRKTVLIEIKSLYDQIGPPPAWGLADSLNLYKNANSPEKKQRVEAAIRQLVSEGLILQSPEHKRLAVNLNPDKIKRILAEIKPWYADPKWVIGTIIAFLGLVAVFLRLYLSK
jgi:hypothetical protein